MKTPKMFLGLEESNLHLFRSRCCGSYLSVEPLCRIASGTCGKTVKRAKFVGA